MYGRARRSSGLLALSIWALFISETVNADCEDEWICVDAVASGDEIELRAKNLGEYPITFTLRVRTQELTVNGPPTVTATLAPKQSRKVIVLSGGSPERASGYRYSLDWTVGDKDAVHDDDYLYALPYEPGKTYRVLQGYGSRYTHTGLEEFAMDLEMPVGTPVHAARSGVVARIQESNNEGCSQDGCGKYANYIVVMHSDGTTGEYYHLARNGAIVEAGEHVARGQLIGFSGNTGYSTTPHLHFAVYRAAGDGNTQSIPVRFLSADAIIDRPRRGARYQAYQ